jgi:heptosyltransferase-1
MADTGSSIARLLVVRLSAMGDVIHALPAVHALRTVFPEVKIGWLIEERWADLLCTPGSPRRGPRLLQRPLVDEVHTVDLKGWRKALFGGGSRIHALQQIATVWSDVRDVHYDIAVDLQGALRSALLARWSGVRMVSGAAETRESPASMWYDRAVIAHGAHVVEQNLSIVEAIAGRRMAVAVSPVELPCDAEVEARVAGGLEQRNVADFAILNPGAGWGAKRWPAERYGEVARKLAGAGICPLVNYGPGEEDVFRAVLAASGGAARPTRGSITELIALTRRARLFIGGDTGPMHLAAALRIPVVAIFGPTDPARNGPYGTRSIVLRSVSSATTHARRAEPEAGMLEISADEVSEAAIRLLSETSA